MLSSPQKKCNQKIKHHARKRNHQKRKKEKNSVNVSSTKTCTVQKMKENQAQYSQRNALLKKESKNAPSQIEK